MLPSIVSDDVSIVCSNLGVFDDICSCSHECSGVSMVPNNVSVVRNITNIVCGILSMVCSVSCTLWYLEYSQQYCVYLV